MYSSRWWIPGTFFTRLPRTGIAPIKQWATCPLTENGFLRIFGTQNTIMVQVHRRPYFHFYDKCMLRRDTYSGG